MPGFYDPPNAVFSGFSFVGFIVALVPFYWHFRDTNVGTCLFMFWASLGCLNAFVNSIAWNGSVLNTAPVWCDISTRIIIAENVAIPAATVCIMRRVYADVSNKVWKRHHETMLDLAIGLLFPILDVALSYIVQGHRFDILEDAGCWPALVDRPPSYALVFIWPLILSIVSVIFGILILRRHLIDRRKLDPWNNADPALVKHYSSMSPRLIFLACCCAFFSIPLCIYDLYLDALSPGYGPWISWSSVHSHFSAVYQVPSVEWKPDQQTRISVEVTRWSNVLCAFVFFALFGFAEEAVQEYRRLWRFVRSRVLRIPET
ncbi:fungal pheromone STE3G-protein-coupled receptor [Artomyces pyxidatus]|uniref:Fungal pheromone STE3G-protein-coupled receptor n=1 Tax=Artomyces pyxidatus TaxID=48021 RepID=A0ACB8SXL4_9AGAM|nr:fungal pheromone STE3G-protein-coupled receptor [Artomyces pyxidatus]